MISLTHPASYHEKLSDHRVACTLCPHLCKIQKGKRGICLTRVNDRGTLVTENYGKVVSLALDPIEKKPLFHFHPGSQILSTGPNGCNLKCAYCQNCEISQKIVPVQECTGTELAQAARHGGSIGIAYTYTEPFIGFEFLLDVLPILREHGMKNVLVTNGFICEKPLLDLLPFVDAMNIDIKSMDPSFYKKICKGKLEPVLRTCEIAKKHCHVEITNLLITGLNDSDPAIDRLVHFVAGHLGADTPLHFSRYFPRYRMTLPPTPEKRLRAALTRGREKLHYVYAGNVHLENGSDTLCFFCGAVLVERNGYHTIIQNLRKGKCVQCGQAHAFIL